MKIVMLGMPGCGKGTQAKMLSEELKIPHISVGHMFRELYNNKDPDGIRYHDEYWGKGILVPDEQTTVLVEKAIKGAKGFILDGYPRKIDQYNTLLKFAKIYVFIGIECDEEAIKSRLTHRAKTDNRTDDSPDKIAVRFDQYNKDTQPLWDFLVNDSEPIAIQPMFEIRKLESDGYFLIIDGNGTKEEISDAIMTALGSLRE